MKQYNVFESRTTLIVNVIGNSRATSFGGKKRHEEKMESYKNAQVGMARCGAEG